MTVTTKFVVGVVTTKFVATVVTTKLVVRAVMTKPGLIRCYDKAGRIGILL